MIKSSFDARNLTSVIDNLKELQLTCPFLYNVDLNVKAGVVVHDRIETSDEALSLIEVLSKIYPDEFFFYCTSDYLSNGEIYNYSIYLAEIKKE